MTPAGHDDDAATPPDRAEGRPGGGDGPDRDADSPGDGAGAGGHGRDPDDGDDGSEGPAGDGDEGGRRLWGRRIGARWGRRSAARRSRSGGASRSGWARWGARGRVAGFALAGAVIALALAGRVAAKVGPFETTVAVRPSWHGETLVRVAPLGTIGLDTHDWPLRVELRVDELGLDEAERIAENPELVDRLGDDLADEVRSALVRLALRCALVGLAGGVLGALAARLSLRSAAAGLGCGALVVTSVGTGVAATFDAEAVAEPRYSGLLALAPTAVGDVEAIVERFGEYRAQLSDLVGNIVTLYLAAEGLPTFEPADGMVRLLHVSDVHLNPQAFDLMEQVSEQFAVDAIVDTGDITDWGTASEAGVVDQISGLDVPYVWVRGNHDSLSTQRDVAAEPNARVLDGDVTEIGGLRLWGIGDPRYTPDKEDLGDTESERERIERFAPIVAEGVADAEPPDVDLVLVHDPRAAADLAGEVPLVLAGHTHEAEVGRLEGDGGDGGDDDEEGGDDGAGDGDEGEEGGADGGTDGEEETLLFTEGSTGGAGLRGLQGQEPEPLTCTVLYFDPDTRRLIAFDRITVSGVGETGATIERHVLDAGQQEAGTGDRDDGSDAGGDADGGDEGDGAGGDGDGVGTTGGGAGTTGGDGTVGGADDGGG